MPDEHHAIPTPRMLRIRREPVVDGVCRLAVTGELDVDSATRLRSEVTAVLGQRPAVSVITTPTSVAPDSRLPCTSSMVTLPCTRLSS